MSKITKLAAPLLAVLMIFSQIATAHAVNICASPTINPKLVGLFTDEAGEYSDECLINVSTLEKSYLGLNAYAEDFKIDSAVSMLNEQGLPLTYFIDTNGYVYVRDAQDERVLSNTGVAFRDRYTAFAAAPMSYQNGTNGCIVCTYQNGVVLYSLKAERELYRIDLPQSIDVVSITPKELVDTDAEYYILDTNGIIWDMVVSSSTFQLLELNQFTQTGMTLSSDSAAIYYDGIWIYMVWPDHGSTVDLFSPLYGSQHEYRCWTNSAVIYDLYEENWIASTPRHSTDAPPTVDIPLVGLLSDNYQTDDVLFSLQTKSGYTLEYRDYFGLSLESAVTQMNSAGEVQTYFFGADNYVYTQDAGDRHYLQQGTYIYDVHTDYAAAPLQYQISNGWVVGLEDNLLSLTSLKNGEDENMMIPLDGFFDAVSITPKSFDSENAEYYILDSNGVVWIVTIRFPDFYITDWRAVIDTGLPAGNNDGFYYDGTWLYRTYVSGNSSCLTMIDPDDGIIYDLGMLGEGIIVRSLYEDGKVPAVELTWTFVDFEWENVSGKYKAYAVYKCEALDLTRKVSATVWTDSRYVSKYIATVSADQSLDGKEHSSSYVAPANTYVGPSAAQKVRPILKDLIIAPYNPPIFPPIDLPINPNIN